MLELKNVAKYYHSNDVTNLGVRNINLKLYKNEIVAITGDSGCGKSTLLNVITKIDTFDEGEIYYKGNETSYFSLSDMDNFRKNKVGFIFQNYNIIDSYSVLKNVMLPLTLKGLSNKEAKEKAIELIKRVGLIERLNHRGTKLSGGEKQRCVVARALASDCTILACDEPTGNLDSKTGKEIIDLIKEVAKDKLVLIVTHNFAEVKDIATRKIRMSDGVIVEDIKLKDVLIEDTKEEIDFDDKKLGAKTCFSVAKNNVLFTPRKSIFLSFIFFAVAISALLLYQSIYSSYMNITNVNSYLNRLDNRIVVNNKHYEQIDLSKLEGYDYDINTFYEDEIAYIMFDDLTTNSSFNIKATYSDRYNYTLKGGRMPDNSNEYVLLLPSKAFEVNVIKNYLNQASFFLNFPSMRFNLSGYAFVEGLSNCVVTGCKRMRTIFSNIILFNPQNIDVNINHKSTFSSLKGWVSTDKYNKFTITLPENYYGANISFKMYGLYDYLGYDVVCNDQIKSIVAYMPQNYELELLNQVFEVSIYSNNPKKDIENLNNLGFQVSYPKEENTGNELEAFITNLSGYLIMVCASFSLIIVFFITYVILAKVYNSKKKDYQILRTLGITKKDMKAIVNYEVMSVGLVITIVAYLCFVIVLYAVPQLKTFRPITLLTSFIYFLVMILYVYLTARRFNRKLYKFSIIKQLKGGQSND